MKLRWRLLCTFACLCSHAFLVRAEAPQDPHRRVHELGDFRLENGVVLPNAKIAYATFGTLNPERNNAVLLPSWYGSDHHGYDFLLGPGRALDPAKYFVIATEMFANGVSSSPSNTPAPFDGPRFPAIAIRDNVEAARRLLTSELGIAHVRAVIGFSMGAQQAFQWAVSHPDFVTQVVVYCGTAKTYPHGVVRLESAISALDTPRSRRFTIPIARRHSHAVQFNRVLSARMILVTLTLRTGRADKTLFVKL